jgi:hypothetical protein
MPEPTSRVYLVSISRSIFSSNCAQIEITLMTVYLSRNISIAGQNWSPLADSPTHQGGRERVTSKVHNIFIE